jgi:hypothetical protein
MATKRQWEIKKDIWERLELFYNVTELFLGSSYLRVNLFFSKMCEVKIV